MVLFNIFSNTLQCHQIYTEMHIIDLLQIYCINSLQMQFKSFKKHSNKKNNTVT